VDGRVILRDARADVLVNGQRMREAVLQAGDQIAFDVQHRFVLEGPPPPPAGPSPAERLRAAFAEDADEAPVAPRRSWRGRMPWLMISAILLAAALSGLLLFGIR
jgi:hypothetical protein